MSDVFLFLFLFVSFLSTFLTACITSSKGRLHTRSRTPVLKTGFGEPRQNADAGLDMWLVSRSSVPRLVPLLLVKYVRFQLRFKINMEVFSLAKLLSWIGGGNGQFCPIEDVMCAKSLVIWFNVKSCDIWEENVTMRSEI